MTVNCVKPAVAKATFVALLMSSGETAAITVCNEFAAASSSTVIVALTPTAVV